MNWIRFLTLGNPVSPVRERETDVQITTVQSKCGSDIWCAQVECWESGVGGGGAGREDFTQLSSHFRGSFRGRGVSLVLEGWIGVRSRSEGMGVSGRWDHTGRGSVCVWGSK